jgi:hypothetical protein
MRLVPRATLAVSLLALPACTCSDDAAARTGEEMILYAAEGLKASSHRRHARGTAIRA